MHHSIKLSAAGVALALALAGCGSDTKGLDSIEYKDQGKDKAPSISFETPLKVEDPTTRTLDEGSGEKIKDGDQLLVEYSIYDGSNQKTLNDTFSSIPQVIPVDKDTQKNNPEIYKELTDSKVGTTFAYSQSPEKTMEMQKKAGSAPSSATATDASVVEVYRVVDKLEDKASGKTAAPDHSLPAVKLQEGKSPKITIPQGKAEPQKLVSHDLVTGSGEKITSDDAVYVKYSGVRWATGKVFDSNWTSAAAGLQLNQTIQGWQKGLVGKTVGSRVELVVPASQAYGTEKQLGKNSQQPAGALVFVVDVLGRADAPQQNASSGAANQQGASPAATPKK